MAASLASLYDLSVTDASNTSFNGISQAENVMTPASVNNSIRAHDGALARYIADEWAVNTATGTDTYALTAAQGITAYATGIGLRFICPNTNTGAATLNVNTIGAKAIRKISGGTDVALVAGDLAAGETYTVIYRSTANSSAGGWVIVGLSAGTTFATQTEAATLTSTTKAVNPNDLTFLGGYATTATAAGTTTLTVTDSYNQYFTGTSTQTVVLPVTSTLVLGRSFRIVNNSTGAVTVQSSGANTITVLAAGMSVVVTCILTSGTTAASWDYRPSIALQAAVATTSGTSVTVASGIPPGVKRITIMLNGVSTNGTSNPMIQIGDSGGVETTGYNSSASAIATTVTTTDFTTGIGLAANIGSTIILNGVIVGVLEGGANWVFSGAVHRQAGTLTTVIVGIKTLSPGPLDRVILTMVNGTDAFDAGEASISWEF